MAALAAVAAGGHALALGAPLWRVGALACGALASCWLLLRFWRRPTATSLRKAALLLGGAAVAGATWVTAPYHLDRCSVRVWLNRPVPAARLQLGWGPDLAHFASFRGNPVDVVLEIVATGEKSARAQANHVSLAALTAGVEAVPLSALTADSPWCVFHGSWWSRDVVQPTALRWRGRTDGPLQLRLWMNPTSGVVELRCNGTTHARIDLWAPTAKQRTVWIDPAPGRALTTEFPAHALRQSPSLCLLPGVFDDTDRTLGIRRLEFGGACQLVLEGAQLAAALSIDGGRVVAEDGGARLAPQELGARCLVGLPCPPSRGALTAALAEPHLLLHVFLLGGLAFALITSRVPAAWLARMLLAGTGIAGTLLAAELGLRALAPRPAGRFLVREPNLRATFRPFPNAMPGVGPVAQFHTNSLGLRGREVGATDRVRILAIGGSTTECLYLDQERAWPAVLERALSRASGVSTWVGNAGVSGHSSLEHTVQARHLLSQPPRLDILVILVGVNDLWRRVALRDADYAPARDRSAAALQSLTSRAFWAYPKAPDETHRRDFALLRLLDRVVPRVSAAQRTHDMVQDDCGKFLIDARRTRAAADRLDRLPELAAALDEYRRNLTEIAHCAKRHRVRLVLLTQPHLYQAGIPAPHEAALAFGWTPPSTRPTYFTARVLAQGLDAYNRTLREVCTATGVECFDAATALPKDLAVMYDDVHFTDEGSRRLGEALARHLLRGAPYAK
ncbi:MAG: hypothetical protein KDC87_03860 [Planctomycetes bacterium]|nr:hypothetical protein [Planctomycetota bacterium]